MREHIARIAGVVLEEADRVASEMDDAIFEATPVLAGDATIEAETQASVRANLLRWLRASATRPERIPSGEAPPEVLDLARTLVRRGIPLESLASAYRRGQNVAWRNWMRAAVRETPPNDLQDVLDRSAESMFGFVDGVLESLFAQARREREELADDTSATRRAEGIRLILDGTAVDEERMSQSLGYELRRRHTAMVLWGESPNADADMLERTAGALARAVDVHRPLVVPAGGGALWGWLATDRDPNLAALRQVMEGAPAGVRVAMGSTGRGLQGFRRSHVEAIEAQRLLAGDPGCPRLTAHREVEVVALAGQDEARAADFVSTVLGPLGGDDDTSARLRETLRVYLDEGEHGPRTARRLNTHRNTVLHRVARAEELLGHPVADRRLALAVALELSHRLPARQLAG